MRKPFIAILALVAGVTSGLMMHNLMVGQLQQAAKPSAGQEMQVGASIPTVVSLFESSLQSSITDSATSMTLVNGTDRAGNTLSGYMCFTIDEGTTVAEFVCGSASSTSITSLTRGISPLTGTSSVASLKYAHRRGASVKITNYPQLAIVSRVLNGNETLPNPLVYDASVSTSTLASTLQNVASVAYVNSVSYAGTANASTAAKGIVEAATTAEVLAGTGTGGTGALLFAPNSLFNQTPSATNIIPVTNSSGKLAQGFLDLAQTFTFTGSVILSGTASLATTTFSALPTAPTSTPTNATELITKSYFDSLSSTSTFGVLTSIATTTSGTWNQTVNIGFQPRYIRLNFFVQGKTPSTGTSKFVGKKGYAVFEGTGLKYVYLSYQTQNAGGLALSGDDGAPESLAAFVSTVNSTDEIQTEDINDASSADGDIEVSSVTIQSLSSTGFTVSVVTDTAGGTNSSNARFKGSYEAWK